MKTPSSLLLTVCLCQRSKSHPNRIIMQSNKYIRLKKSLLLNQLSTYWQRFIANVASFTRRLMSHWSAHSSHNRSILMSRVRTSLTCRIENSLFLHQVSSFLARLSSDDVDQPQMSVFNEKKLNKSENESAASLSVMCLSLSYINQNGGENIQSRTSGTNIHSELINSHHTASSSFRNGPKANTLPLLTFSLAKHRNMV